MEEQNKIKKEVFQGYKGIKGSSVYQTYSCLLPLQGESYDLARKSAFYSMFGDKLKTRPIIVGQVYDDTRINIGYSLKPGHGKKIIDEFVKKCTWADKEYNGYVQPTSFHQEQLVGKIVCVRLRGGRIEYRPNYGHLSNNVVVFEEAIEFLVNKEFQIARNYVGKALDPIGQNELVKWNVDNPATEVLRYMPTCTMIFFFQPLNLPEALVERGFLRRCIIVHLEDIPLEERLDVLKKRTKHVESNDSLWREFGEFLTNLRKREFSWEFPDDVIELIEEKTRFLIKYGMTHGPRAKKFTDTYFFVLQNLMFKMSAIQAAIHGRDKITRDDVYNAFVDLLEFWKVHLNFVVTKVIRNIAIDKHKRVIVDILKEKNCISKEASTLSIDDLLKEFCKKTGKKKSTARMHYLKLKGDAIIDSEQIGQHESKVWLKAYI